MVPNVQTQSVLDPLLDRVVIKAEEGDEMSKGGIYLPDSAKEKPTRGRVLSVGSGPILDNGDRAPMDVRPGDRVFFSKYSGHEVEHEGEQLVICRIGDILAVIR